MPSLFSSVVDTAENILVNVDVINVADEEVPGISVVGTPEADYLYGTVGDDELYGLGGPDVLGSSAGDDLVRGGEGDDYLYTEAGDDILKGDTGDDFLVGGLGADQLEGGLGFDTASYASAASGVLLDLTTGTGVTGEAAGDMLISIERVIGSSYGDILNGSNTADVLQGGTGDDYLFGQADADVVDGGSGIDIIEGGAGEDTLSGGSEADRFRFSPHEGPDVITDFQPGVDHIQLTGFGPGLFGVDGNLAWNRNISDPTEYDFDRAFFDEYTGGFYAESPDTGHFELVFTVVGDPHFPYLTTEDFILV